MSVIRVFLIPIMALRRNMRIRHHRHSQAGHVPQHMLTVLEHWKAPVLETRPALGEGLETSWLRRSHARCLWAWVPQNRLDSLATVGDQECKLSFGACHKHSE